MNFGGMIEIKDISGKTRFSTPINKGAKGKFTLMKEDYIILPFSVPSPIPFKIGDYVDLAGELDESLGGKLAKIYEITDIQKPTYNTSTGGYDYELKLDAYYWKWKNKVFKYTPEHAGSEASWSLTAALDVQLGVFLRNLKALGYTYRGTDFTFSIDDTVENKAVAMTYDNINLLDALFSMAGEDKWDCDCWITDNVIHFGRNEFGDAVKIERGVEASSITRSESQGTYATRIYAFGSTKNIPTNYRPTDEQAVVNGVVQKRLMLPADTPYIDAYEGMSQEEAIEDVVVFDDVYPRRVGTLSDVHTRTEEVNNEDGTKETVTYYRYKDTGLVFKDEYIIEGQELKIRFKSGKLNGMEFGVIFNPTPKDETRGEQLWEIVRNENYGRPLPDDMMYPADGDEYILSGFDIQLVSDQYTPAAERELKEKAQKYADKVNKDDGTYPTTLRSSWVKEDLISRTFEFGQRINLVDDTYFESGRISRVLGWEMNLDVPWDSPIYTIGESMPYSRIGEIEDKVDSLTYKGQTYTGGGSGVYVIKVNDSTAPSDSNVFSSLRSRAEFVSKKFNDTVIGMLTFLQTALFREGAVFGKDGFAEGLTGFGAKIGADGRGEMRSLKVWEELIVPLLVYNRVDIVIGDKWRSPGAGVIESVSPDTDAEGNLLPSGTATLKLEDGEIGAIAVGDMNMGIWHFGDERDATEDSDDGIGNFNFAGFTTAYWRITEIQDQDNKTFRYVLRDGYNVHPQPQMKFSCRGNFTNEKRQTSVYETRTYTRMLWKQNDWEIGKRNIALQYGDLNNLNIFGINATGYAFYGNSLYFTGTVTQIREDGTEVMVANDRTDWSPGDFAAYYDRVSYEGELWICISKDGTNTIPSKDDPTWKLQVKSGKNIKDGGRWRTGLTVDEMTLVTMGGKTFISKVQTSNPPLWTVMDNFGNRILKSDGGYILTGEMNTDEYELIVENGADGKDAVTYEYIYQRTASQSAPSTPATSQTEGYVPSGWSAISQGVSDSYPYEWRCERKRSSAGIWSDWSNPSLVSSYGKQGLQGCVVRDSEWAIGVQYRNDSALTTNIGVRYIDVVLVRNDSTTTGWDAYQCKKTHVSSSSITYTNTEYWDKFDTNVGAIFTSLIIAKNAKINFLSGNQLTIQKSNGTVTAGLSGSETGKKIRIWSGSETPDDAPFRVDENGDTWATKAHVEGEIVAKSGTFEGYIKTGFKKLEESDAEQTTEEYVYGVYYYKLNTDLNIMGGAIILPSDKKFIGSRVIICDKTTMFSRSTILSACKSEDKLPILGFPIEGEYEGRYSYNEIYFAGGVIELVGIPNLSMYDEVIGTQWAIISLSCIQSRAGIV